MSPNTTGAIRGACGTPGEVPAGSGSVLESITVIPASLVTLSVGPSWAALQLTTLPAQDKTPIHSGSWLLSEGAAHQHSPVAIGPHLGPPASHHSAGQTTVPRDLLARITALPVTGTAGISREVGLSL